MTGAAESLVGRGPNRSVGAVAAGEVAVAVGPGAGSAFTAPDCAATISEIMPDDFGDGIGRLLHMLRVGDKDWNIMTGIAEDAGAQGIAGYMRGMRADTDDRGTGIPPDAVWRRPRRIIFAAMAYDTGAGGVFMAIDARDAHLAPAPVGAVAGGATRKAIGPDNIPVKIDGCRIHPF